MVQYSLLTACLLLHFHSPPPQGSSTKARHAGVLAVLCSSWQWLWMPMWNCSQGAETSWAVCFGSASIIFQPPLLQLSPLAHLSPPDHLTSSASFKPHANLLFSFSVQYTLTLHLSSSLWIYSWGRMRGFDFCLFGFFLLRSMVEFVVHFEQNEWSNPLCVHHSCSFKCLLSLTLIF